MSTHRPATIVEIDGSAPKRLRSRCQRYCRSLVIAASVVLQQIGPNTTLPMRENPPYVQLLEEPPKRFSHKEVVGRSILTTELIVSDNADRETCNPN